MKGPPLPIPKCKPLDKDVQYFINSNEKKKKELESKVIKVAKKWNTCIREHVSDPSSEIKADNLTASYYALDDSIRDLISFEKSI